MSITKKFLGVSVAIAMFAGVAVAPASAATIEELQAQIAQLTAALAALSGGSTTGSASYTYNMDLTIGSTGADVVALQDFLISKGHLVMPAGVAKGYFGALTQSALAKYQASVGIAPAAGYFGPITRAHMNAMVGNPGTPGNDDGDTDSTDLSGDFGTISDVDKLGAYNNEEVGDGEEEVKVLGADIEASNDGDIRLISLKVSFDPTGNAGSDNLDDYVDRVTVWLGDKEIGSADVDDFTESSGSIFSRTISLKGAIIEADETEKLYVTVDAVNNLDSGDIGANDSWTVGIDNIRFEDGSGVVTTDSTTGDLGDAALTITTAGTGGVAIDFVSFSTAADTELKISTDSDSPEAGIVIADSSSDTDNVSLLKGRLKLDGSSDVVLDEFPVTLTVVTSGTANGVDDIAGSVTLKINGQEFSESVTGDLASALTGTVTFDNLDLDIDAGDTVEFEILADVNNIDGTVFVAGDTLKASVTSTNRDYMDVENEEGDQLSDSSEKSGTATGEAQEFRTNGIMLTLVSASGPSPDNSNPNDDLGTFTLKFKVTAIGDTVYVSSLADAQLTGNTNGKTTILVDRAGTATVGGVTASIENDTDTDLNAAGLWQIEEGDSETLTLTTTVQLPAAGLGGVYHAVLGGVMWTTDSTDATPSNSYTSNLDSFKATGTLN